MCTVTHAFSLVLQGMQFSNCGTCIDTASGGSGNIGSVALIDSSATNTGTVISTKVKMALMIPSSLRISLPAMPEPLSSLVARPSCPALSLVSGSMATLTPAVGMLHMIKEPHTHINVRRHSCLDQVISPCHHQPIRTRLMWLISRLCRVFRSMAMVLL